MQSVERRITAVNRAASNLPFTYNEKLREDILADTERHPTAPVEITYETSLYQPDGLATEYGRLFVEFPDVTKATDGTLIPIREYELWGRDDTTNYLEATTSAVPGVAAPGLTIPGLAATQAMKDKAEKAKGPFKRLATSRVSSLRAERLVPGSVWTFTVRAIGQFTTTAGEFSPEFQTQIAADTTPPPQPTMPELSTSLGTITARWGGLSVLGSMPGDFAYLEVAGGYASSPTQVIDRFYRGGGITVVSDLEYYKPYFIRFRAVDLSGNKSPWGEQAVAFAKPLVDTDVILAEIDANHTILKNIGEESIKDGAIRDAKLAANAVTLEKLDESVQAAVQEGVDALAAVGPLQVEAAGNLARLAAAEKGLDASEGRLTEAEGQLTDAFGQLGTVDTRIDTAKQATLTAAASTAQDKADAALTAANAQIAQVIARGQSLVRNGDFEAGGDGWATNSFAVIDSSVSRSGTKSLKIGPNPGGNIWPVSEWVPGSTGRTYYLEMWIKRTGAESIPAGVGFVLQAKTAAGGTATATFGTVDSTAIATASFTKVTATFTVSTADTVSTRFAPWVKAGNNVYNVDDILVVDVTEAQAALTAANQAQSDATAAQTAAGSAQSTADTALDMAGSKGRSYYSTSAPSGSGSQTGDIWRQRNGTNEIIGEWQWSGSVWTKTTVSGSIVSNMDIGYLTAGAATMSQALINKLVAGTANFQTVDVKNLFATSGTLDSAVITKLWTEVVNSQKINTKMLAVTDFENFAPSPAESPGDWTLTGGMVIVNNSSISVSGSRFEAVGNTSTAWAYGPQKSVTPGEKLYAAATVYRSSANDTTGAYLRYQWYDKNKATLASPQYTGTQTTGPSGTRMEVVVEVPAGAAYAILTLPIVTAGVGKETLRTSIYDVVAKRQAGTVLIENGAVNADKVNAQSVAGAVGSFINLNVSQLSATTAGISQAVIDKLWADVVNSRKITTNMLLVGSGPNMIPNGALELGDSSGWVSGLTYDSADKPTGFQASLRSAPASGTVSYVGTFFDVQPNTEYLFEFWMKADKPNSKIYIELRDQNNAHGTTSVNVPGFPVSAGGAYPASNVTVPTGWTKYAVAATTTATANKLRIGGLYFNHPNGTEQTATVWVAGFTMRPRAAGSIIATGAISAPHLGVDSVTAAAIKALSIGTGELAANAVQADKIDAGAVTASKLESTLVLSTRIVAGPISGTHAEMDGNGFHSFNTKADGTLYETVRMGVADTNDLLTLTDSTGAAVSQLLDDGTITGRVLEAKDALYYKGTELNDYIDTRPRGMVAWGQVPVGSNMSVASGNEVGLFELAWDGGDTPSRMYEFTVNEFLARAEGAGTVCLILRMTTDGTAPTITSPVIGRYYAYAGGAGYVGMSMSRIIGSTNGSYIRVLASLYSQNSGGASVYSGNQYLYSRVMDLGVNQPPNAIATTGGGTPASGGTVASPTVAKITKTTDFQYKSVKSYTSDGNWYNYNTTRAYQGKSPAGYGNLSSQYGFNTNFQSLLSGATIEGIWVYLYFEHWYYSGGGTAQIRLHNNLAVPSTNVGMTGFGIDSSGWPKGSGRWVALPSSLWSGFASGAYKGFGLQGDSTFNTYGIANNAAIRIKYTK